MGIIFQFVGQVFVGCIALGALKHKGAISIHPSAIENEAARLAFTQAVLLGETATVYAYDYYESLMREINSNSKKK